MSQPPIPASAPAAYHLEPIVRCVLRAGHPGPHTFAELNSSLVLPSECPRWLEDQIRDKCDKEYAGQYITAEQMETVVAARFAEDWNPK
jgi:hypothetical protein